MTADLARWAYVPTPPHPTPRWPGLMASVGGETGVRAFMDANPSEPDVDAWQLGFKFRPLDLLDTNAPLDPCNQTAFTLAAGPAQQQNGPLIHWSSVKCSTMSGDSADLEARAQVKIMSSTSHKLETELWTGDGAETWGKPTPYLTDVLVTQINSGVAIPLAYAHARLAMQAGALAEGQRLAICCTPMLADLWASAGVVRKENGLLLDAFDNIVIAGTGFTGSGPGMPVDTTYQTSWAYAILVPQVRLSGVTVSSQQNVEVQGQHEDVINNVDAAIAWRVGTTSFDPDVHLAVNVDMCNVCCTS